jgi:hypothetical protein
LRSEPLAHAECGVYEVKILDAESIFPKEPIFSPWKSNKRLKKLEGPENPKGKGLDFMEGRRP